MVFVMRSILNLQLQLMLLIIIIFMLSMVTPRSSSIELLASSARAIRLSSIHNEVSGAASETSERSEVSGDHQESVTVTSVAVARPHQQQHPDDARRHRLQRPATAWPRGAPHPAFIILSPHWHYQHFDRAPANNRRQDDLEFAASNNRDKPPIMVAWPSRQIALRFIAAMAVPVSSFDADPLLTQRELSEVVYYSSMDLHKINTTANRNEILKLNKYNTDDEISIIDDYDQETTNDDSDNVVTPAYEAPPPDATLGTYASTTPNKSNSLVFFATPVPTFATDNDLNVKVDLQLEQDQGEEQQKRDKEQEERGKEQEERGEEQEQDQGEEQQEEERQRRSWSHEGTSPRAAGGLRPASTDGAAAGVGDGGQGSVRQWMDGESVAYIAVGTCCGLSVVTLAVVLLLVRLRIGNRGGATSSRTRTHFTIPTLANSSSSIDSSSEISDDSASLHLPQRLLSLMNTRSQEVSTHKLGSWFNGRPTTLSIRHGGNMAFPAPPPRLQLPPEQQDEEEPVLADLCAAAGTGADSVGEGGSVCSAASSCSSSSSNGGSGCDGASVCSLDDAQCPPQLLQLDSDSQLQQQQPSTDHNSTLSGSKHDTFIFWSTNSDRLV